MIPNDNLTIGVLFFTITILTLILWASTRKSEKLKENIEELKEELATIRTRPTTPLNTPIPGPENYTIIDLIYDEKFTEDELDSTALKEEQIREILKENAIKYFINEIDRLGAIQEDFIRKPYARRPNHYRFITKIALRDEK